jgi:predicted cupin superfamily sugar epimerase
LTIVREVLCGYQNHGFLKKRPAMKAYEKIIETLDLSKHPEGGYFRQIYKSHFIIRPEKESYKRSCATHIYYYLQRGMYSKFHKVKHDEIWNLYDGESVKLHVYDEMNNKVDEQILSKRDFKFHAIVQGDLWQAAEPVGDFVLVGCTVAPGWELEDEAYLSDHPKILEKLVKLKPNLQRLI